MKFEMWSVMHILYLMLPIAILLVLWLFLNNASGRCKYIVGIFIGLISISIIVLRNVDIYLRDGLNAEVIPLQVCHIGSLVVGFALITRNKSLLITAFCFNLIPAILAMVFADALANYDTILKIRPQTYIWGHIFIVVGAIYGICAYKREFNKKDVMGSLFCVFICLAGALVCNNAFRHYLSWTPNYFYLYDYKGTPLKFLYDIIPASTYGWFLINWVYVGVLVAVFIFAYLILYFIARKISYRED